jgi:hypothetical protein
MAGEPQLATEKKSSDVVVRSRSRTVREGHLPLSEFSFDRPGAASPFGDDLSLPLPLAELTYVHPTEDAPPAHL